MQIKYSHKKGIHYHIFMSFNNKIPLEFLKAESSS